MLGPIPRPLEDDFSDVLIALARRQRLPAIDEVERLAPRVAKLAAAYNHPGLHGVRGVDHRAARLGFSFARDVPKMAAAVREMIAIGRIAVPSDRPLRVLDLGAGLGASHRGLARALDAAGARGTLDVLAIDEDEPALVLARDIATARPREGDVAIRLRAEVSPLARCASGRFDVVLVGQVLSELDLDRGDDDRVAVHRALLARTVRHALADDGVIVVVEPALRARARHLQRIRGALLAHGDAHVLAPCLHEGRCPLLGRETDWCHEDLSVDLPRWLVPVARAAGLRWEGLTYAYLILARDSTGLRAALSMSIADDERAERAVSALLRSKGKREVVLCGDPLRATTPAEDPHGLNGARTGRLDREASATNRAIEQLARGDLVAVTPPLDDKGRLRVSNRLRILG